MKIGKRVEWRGKEMLGEGYMLQMLFVWLQESWQSGQYMRISSEDSKKMFYLCPPPVQKWPAVMQI